MGKTPPKPREVPRYASLATRFAALYSVLVGFAVLLAGWLIHAGNRERVLENRERELEHRARIVQVRIESEVGALSNDVLFLAKAPFLRHLADSWDNNTQSRASVVEVQGSFAALLKGKPSYAQTRLLELSEEGMEIIRLDHVRNEVNATPPEALQPKGYRDYFRESANLQSDEIYLSSINLNREFGEISVPHIPTLRAAAKVFDSEGRPFGLVVINVDLRTLFSELRTAAGEGTSLYIANAKGDYLVHPDASKTFGFDLGLRHRLEDDFGPDLLRSAQSPNEIIRFVRVPLRENSNVNLIIGVGIPRERVLTELTSIRNRSLAAALSAAGFAATIVWGLAFLLSRRLSNLADAIGRYEPGSGSPVLPDRGNDEVAVVARKFTSMSAKIDEQVRALETARELADENRRAKEEFLATLSHEIRTPMNAVTGLLHTLTAEKSVEDQRSVIESLQFVSRKLIAVVNEVLDFSKIEAGQVTFEQAPFDLRELLASVQTSHLPQAREGGIELACEQDGKVPRFVCGDSLRIYQVLTNLVQNALKFTKPGGTVTIRVRRVPRGGEGKIRLSFCVEDTGIGMTPEQLSLGLSRFGQAQPGGAQKIKGTGLGLPIARMLVELQGGDFKATSTEGIGSRFQLELEFGAVPEGAEVQSSAVRGGPNLEGIRILCVEDVDSNRQVVSALLDACGARVTFATNAKETLETLEQCSEAQLPDLILLDLQLPDRDGASLAVEIRRRWPELSVVGLTAQTAGSLLERCKRAGVATFLWKPIDPQLLYETVEREVKRALDADMGASGSGSHEFSDVAGVLEVFDRDSERTERYLLTLANELDESAAALPNLVEAGDHEGLRELYHRLKNGLTLIKAAPVIQALDSLSALVYKDPAAAQKLVARCEHVLGDTASELRKWTRENTAHSGKQNDERPASAVEG